MSTFLELRIHLIFNQYFYPILLILGTFGNIIVIVILTKAGHRKYSTARFMLALAISDLLNLWLVVPVVWVRAVFDYDINRMQDSLCKAHLILAHFVSHSSILYIVALNIERFLTVSFPQKSKVYCSLRNANIAIAITPLTAFVILFHSFYRIGIAEKDNCFGRNEIYKDTVWWIWRLAHLFLLSFASFILMFIINVYIMIKFAKHNCRLKGCGHFNQNEVRGNAYRGKMSQITITLTLVTISFLICVFPIAIYSLIYDEVKRPSGITHEEAKKLLFYSIAYGCMLITNVINFFIYFLRGSKFRNEVKLLLCKKTPHVHVHPV